MEDHDYTAMPAFLAGALIGAGIALLLAPQTGMELRGMLRSYAKRAKDEAYDRGREAWDTAVDRGKEYLETGRETVKEAGKTAREYMETGKETLREAGRDISKETSRNRG